MSNPITPAILAGEYTQERLRQHLPIGTLSLCVNCALTAANDQIEALVDDRGDLDLMRSYFDRAGHAIEEIVRGCRPLHTEWALRLWVRYLEQIALAVDEARFICDGDKGRLRHAREYLGKAQRIAGTLIGQVETSERPKLRVRT